jgi:hypothetical protein
MRLAAERYGELAFRQRPVDASHDITADVPEADAVPFR